MAEVPAELISSAATRERQILASLLVSRGRPAIFRVPWLIGTLPNIPTSAFSSHGFLLMGMSACAPQFPLLIRTPIILD